MVAIFFALNYFGINVKNPLDSEEYYAVYLISGDVYFGKMNKFPNLSLSDVYFLVRGKDVSGADAFALQRLQDAVWGPENMLYLNPKNILWKAKLRKDGAAMKVIAGEDGVSNALPNEIVLPGTNEINMLPDGEPSNASSTES